MEKRLQSVMFTKLFYPGLEERLIQSAGDRIYYTQEFLQGVMLLSLFSFKLRSIFHFPPGIAAIDELRCLLVPDFLSSSVQTVYFS